ncbi:ribosome maturation factor RimM [Candidatus Soleaferrea massiliensis]|uniref:ribosome maturation factor RimM n=1 Tax=Candidatus Soleaferrea massiliensis TaxID=1470354 RepID=UPI00058E9A1A|nr:ribosome maturation factor RimM [Candidatus Soleaferrea massiliensis]
MKKQFLETGKIVTTHGIKGELKVMPWCDTPEFLLDFDTLYLQKGQKPIEIENARIQKNMVLLKIRGCDTVEDAVKLRGQVLYLNRDDVELEEGGFFMQDLIGVEVLDADDGRRYGEICDVTETGANDVYHIRFEDGCVKLIPAIKDVVKEIDIEENRMLIRPLRGLFDDAD